MSVLLQGDLAHFRADELLTLLSANKHTGTLEASSNKQHARIIFQDGTVVHAEATKATDAKEAVLAPFTWAAGSFTFVDQAAIPAGAAPAAIDLTSVIGEGRQRASEWQQFAAAYPDENVVLRVVDNPAIQGSITLSSDEFRLLVHIGGGRSLAQLGEDLQSPFIEVCRTVYRLESAGLLRRAESAVAEVGKTAVIDRSMIRSVPPEPAEDRRPRLSRPENGEPPSSAPLVGTLTAPTGSMFPLVDAEISIGRDASCAIAITDGSISPTHAKITRGPQGFNIEDLGSRNGTFVNGDRLTQRRLLVNQDVLRLGKVLLTFNLATPAADPKATKKSGR